MRIISFTERWGKLEDEVFTTFRFPRKDKDWYVGERVQVYYKNRSPQREKLGEAVINGKESRLGANSDKEAQDDGFLDARDMEKWMIRAYGEARTWTPMNKLTLVWQSRQSCCATIREE